MNVMEEEVAMCMICDDEEITNSLTDYPCCNHSCHFGIQCLKRIVSDKITESSISNLVCPYPGCHEKLNQELVKALATESEYNKYINDLSDINDLNNNISFKTLSIIAKHLQYFFQDTISNCAQLCRRVTVDSKRCPNCHYIIEKDGGCNHMTCRKCSYQFHWCCGQKYSSHHSNALCHMYQYAIPSIAILTPIIALLSNSYTREAIYSTFASFSYMSNVSNVTIAIWLLAYVACTALVTCFLGKWRFADNDLLNDRNLLLLILLASSVTYATNQHDLAKLTEDPNPYTGLQQLLLLACMSMDQYDLKDLLYRWKSNNHIVNIVFGFSLVYLTDSPLFHAFYIIPFCFKYSYQLDDCNLFRWIICATLIMAAGSIYLSRMSYRCYISNVFGFIVLSLRIMYLCLFKDGVNNSNYDLNRFLIDIEAITGKKLEKEKMGKLNSFLNNYVVLGSYIVVASGFTTVSHLLLDGIKICFLPFSLIVMVTKLLNFSAIFNYSIIMLSFLYWAIKSSYWIFTFSIFLKTSLLWFSRIKVSALKCTLNGSEIFFSILYLTFLCVVMVRSAARLNERFIYISINFCLALVFTNRDKSQTKIGKSEIVADFDYEYYNFLDFDWVLYSVHLFEPIISPCISNFVWYISLLIPGYEIMMLLLVSTAIAAPLYYFSYIK